MPKLKFDRKAMAGFFVKNVEKVVLVVVLLLFVTFVYTGYSLEGLPSDRSPEALAELTARAKNHINSDTWEAIADEHRPASGLEERAKVAERSLTDAVAYAAAKPYLPETKASGKKRTDPELLAPIEVEADVVIGSLAAVADGRVDPLADLEDTEVRIKKKKRARKTQKQKDEDFNRSFNIEEDTGDVDPFAQVSGGGPDIYGEEEDGKTPAVAADRTFPGYRPETTDALPVSKAMVAVKALVPIKKQWAIYDETFASAMHYNRDRDNPKYLAYEVERADVTDDGGAPAWRMISSTNVVVQVLPTLGWVGLSGEIADGRYVSGRLTMPVPPIMMRQSEDFALHSKVPRVRKAAKVEEIFVEDDRPIRVAAPDLTAIAEIGAVPLATPTATGSQTGPGPFGMFGSGARSAPAKSRTSAAGPPAEFVMIRCFDLNAEIGKKYRYRFRVYVEDANRPNDARLRPQERALAKEVVERLDAVKEDYAGYRITDWSQPSDVVEVAMPRQTLAGPVSPGRTTTVADVMDIPVGESKAQVLSIVHDPQYGVDVPAFIDAYRGSYLNVTQDVDVIHPVTLAFKKVEKYSLETDRMLVDFRGGEMLPKIEREVDEEADEEVIVPDLFSASEYIFLDADGNFFVRNDLDDKKQFDLFVVPEKEEGTE